MFKPQAAFSGFSVDNLASAKQFYTETLGLELVEEEMGLQFKLPDGGLVFVYDKPDHQPATYTMLNLVVADIDAAVKELTKAGVKFEHFEGMPQTPMALLAAKRTTWALTLPGLRTRPATFWRCWKD